MGHPKATLLLKNTPAPQRPPPDVPLEAWGHEHVCYNGLKGKARWFKVCDLVYTDSKQFMAWPYIEAWLELIADGRIELTYEEGIGFGLRARTVFKKGARVVPGTCL